MCRGVRAQLSWRQGRPEPPFFLAGQWGFGGVPRGSGEASSQETALGPCGLTSRAGDVFLFPSHFTGAPTHQAPQTHHSVLRLLFDDLLQPDRVWGICLSVCLSDTFTAITSTAHAPRRFSTKMHGMNSCRELGVRMWEAVSVLGGDSRHRQWGRPAGTWHSLWPKPAQGSEGPRGHLGRRLAGARAAVRGGAQCGNPTLIPQDLIHENI